VLKLDYFMSGEVHKLVGFMRVRLRAGRFVEVGLQAGRFVKGCDILKALVG